MGYDATKVKWVFFGELDLTINQIRFQVFLRRLLRMDAHCIEKRLVGREQVFRNPKILLGFSRSLLHEVAFDFFTRLHR